MANMGPRESGPSLESDSWGGGSRDRRHMLLDHAVDTGTWSAVCQPRLLGAQQPAEEAKSAEQIANIFLSDAFPLSKHREHELVCVWSFLVWGEGGRWRLTFPGWAQLAYCTPPPPTTAQG